MTPFGDRVLLGDGVESSLCLLSACNRAVSDTETIWGAARVGDAHEVGPSLTITPWPFAESRNSHPMTLILSD
jgi:hypothetical protein